MRITALLARKDTLYMPAKKVDTNHSNGHGSVVSSSVMLTQIAT
jgi:hypothetical protein